MSQNCKLIPPRNLVIISDETGILLCYESGKNSRQVKISQHTDNEILNRYRYSVSMTLHYNKYYIFI